MPILTQAQVVSYAQAAGFSGRALDIVVAIAHAESGFDTQAVNVNTDSHTFPDGHTGPSTDRGLMQINNYWQPYTDAQAFDPAQAMIAAYAISSKGTDFQPWSTFKNGAYRQYLPAISALLPNAEHFSEFQGGYHGTCGETALATALTCAGNQTDTAAGAIALMLAMTKEMIALGWAASNGATTTAHLHDEAKRRGYTPDDAHYISFANQIDPNLLHNVLLQFAGVKPIILEIARAYALPGDEAGVQYHFICVVGVSPTGYICNDGDNSTITSHLVSYDWAQIEAAAPCGILVIDPLGAPKPVNIPTGWTDDGTLLHNPENSFTVGTGFRGYILANGWDPKDVPIDAEQSVTQVEEFNTSHGPGTRQHFHFSQLSWTSKDGVFKTWLGDEAVFLLAKIAATPPPVSPSVKTALVAALNNAQSEAALVAELQAALATLG